MNDDDLLSKELGWIDPDPDLDRRWFRTSPSGVHVMNAFAGVIVLGAIAGNLALLGPVNTEAGLGRPIGFLLETVLAFVAARWISRRIWRAIGSVLRGLLRPLGVLGPVPMIALLVIGGAALLALPAIRERQAAEARADRYDGVEFRALLDGSGHPLSGTLAEARAACADLGEGWRLPRRADSAFLAQRLLRPMFRHLAFCAEPEPGDPQGLPIFMFDDRARRYDRASVQSGQRSAIVCINPP